jgi:hypothetical protein
VLTLSESTGAVKRHKCINNATCLHPGSDLGFCWSALQPRDREVMSCVPRCTGGEQPGARLSLRTSLCAYSTVTLDTVCTQPDAEYQLLLVFPRTRVQVSTRRPASLLKFFVVFLSSYGQMPMQYQWPRPLPSTSFPVHFHWSAHHLTLYRLIWATESVAK